MMMRTSPLGTAFAFTLFALAPILHPTFTGFMVCTPVLGAMLTGCTFTGFASLNVLCVLRAFVLTPFLLATFLRFVMFPRLLLCLAGRNIVVAPAALLAVIPTCRAMIGDVLRLFVVAPTVVIAVVIATVVGKGAAA
jgi:hypothetical protein